MPELHRYRRNVYSDGGEDGVLAEIFRRLGVQQGWFCEVGARDGKHVSNTYRLVEQGWYGASIEANHEVYLDLARTSRTHAPQMLPIHAHVEEDGETSLDAVLEGSPLPRDFQLLSIDTDGPEYFVWRGVNQYQPWVVVIEVIGELGPRMDVVSSDWDNGSSFRAMLKLAQSKGYTPVCHTLDNVCFVRNDIVSALGLPHEDVEDPYSLFCADAMNRNILRMRLRRLRWMSRQRLGMKLGALVRPRLRAHSEAM